MQHPAHTHPGEREHLLPTSHPPRRLWRLKRRVFGARPSSPSQNPKYATGQCQVETTGDIQRYCRAVK